MVDNQTPQDPATSEGQDPNTDTQPGDGAEGGSPEPFPSFEPPSQKMVPEATMMARLEKERGRTAERDQELDALRQEVAELKASRGGGQAPQQSAQDIIAAAVERGTSPLVERVQGLERRLASTQDAAAYSEHRQRFRAWLDTLPTKSRIPPGAVTMAEQLMDEAANKGTPLDPQLALNQAIGHVTVYGDGGVGARAAAVVDDARKNAGPTTPGRSDVPGEPMGGGIEGKTLAEMTYEEIEEHLGNVRF